MNWIFANGPVFTGDAARRWVEAVAVADDTIVAVGGYDNARSAVEGDFEFVDLEGRMLIAGFQDAHVHPLAGGLARLRCNLEDAETLDQALAIVAAHAADGEGWLTGAGWRYSWFPGGNPSAALLDAITDRPVSLVGADGHSSWLNSPAMALAGIDARTPDPPDGRIERDESGAPLGVLHEGAMRLGEAVLPPETPESLVAGLLEGQRYLHSVGVTAWQDAWVDERTHRAYLRAVDGGDLTATVRAALWWDRERGLDQLEELVTRKGRGRYSTGTIKLMLDGVCENHTAALLAPYLDAEGKVTENAGLDFIDREMLREAVVAIDAAGWQAHFHALGDRAVRHALDAVAAARSANGWQDTRHHLAHLQVVHPDDVARFAPLGAFANCQPLWAQNDEAMTELTVPFLGPERARWQYPFADLAAAGAPLAMGSDWPVSTADVMQQVAVAVERRAPGEGRDAAFLPEQRLRLGEALVGFTAGSAAVNHRDRQSGTVEEGKRADLVLLSANPFEADDISTVSVALTMVGGDVVYEAAA